MAIPLNNGQLNDSILEKNTDYSGYHYYYWQKGQAFCYQNFGLFPKKIGHFTVLCLVTWPMTASEAGVDLALIQTSPLFSCKCKLVSIRTSRFRQKYGEVCIETKSFPASLPFKGQVTEQATVKWSIWMFISFLGLQSTFTCNDQT